MKAILEFNLDDPDDAMAHLRCVKSLDMALVLWDTFYNMKKAIHHRIERGDFKDQHEVIDKVFEMFKDQLDEKGIIVDELIN
jgi:DNA-binding ferritin-like protein